MGEYGSNEIPSTGRRTIIAMLVSQFKNPLIYALVFAAVIASFLGDVTEAAIIIAIVIVNTLLGFAQEYKSEKAVDELRRYISYQAVVFREGKKNSVDTAGRRFLIGEYVFNPNHEIFQSYFNRGLPRPGDVKVGDTSFKGMLDFGDAIVEAVERCPAELQLYLYKQILLSGGNFAWNAPVEVSDVAIDAPNKIRRLLETKGITDTTIMMTESPQYSVWLDASSTATRSL